jgi:hypothetical protein
MLEGRIFESAVSQAHMALEEEDQHCVCAVSS